MPDSPCQVGSRLPKTLRLMLKAKQRSWKIESVRQEAGLSGCPEIIKMPETARAGQQSLETDKQPALLVRG